jgi:hypothetical protein
LLAFARTEVVMSAALELELRNLKLGDHACVLYDGAGRADDWETIVPTGSRAASGATSSSTTRLTARQPCKCSPRLA